MTRKRMVGRTVGWLALLGCALAAASCGSTVREGRSPGYLIIDYLTAASGVYPERFGNTLESDVVTIVTTRINGQEVRVPTIYEDFGRVRLRLGLKDVTSPTGPTTNNEITVTNYRVVYKRADGRNTPGVDVPYGFDGAITGTIDEEGQILSFVLVRIQAKEEAPLKALGWIGGANTISTIAEVTFYGRDQAGNDVTVKGTISVNFADWGDPNV